VSTDSCIRAKIKCVITFTVRADLVHAPAQTGIEWNEMANLMAKLAVQDTITPSLDVSYPTAYGLDAGFVLPFFNSPVTLNRHSSTSGRIHDNV